MTSPHLLLLTDWFPPAYKAGGPVRSCLYFARAMKAHFRISVLTSDRDAGDHKPLPNIPIDTWIEFEPGIRVFYASPDRANYSSLLKLIRDEAPDHLYLNSLFSRQFTLNPLWMLLRKRITPNVVLAPRGMLQAGALQYKSLKKQTFIRLFRTLGIPQQITFHATDAQEQKDILQYFPNAKRVEVAPNFAQPDQPDFAVPKKEKGSIRLLFISRVAAKKNVLGLLEALQPLTANCQLPTADRLLPTANRLLPTANCHLRIIGPQEDNAYLEQCKKQVEKLPANIQVDWVGPLPPEKIADELSKCHLFALPTFGENFGHAIFEALLAGRPVLISDQTPWQDLESQKAGWVVPLSEMNTFSDRIKQLANMDQMEYDLWAKGAWQYAKTYLENSDLPDRYLAIFNVEGKR